MKIGFDYWNVISSYPEYFAHIADLHLIEGDEVHVISAIGKNRIGTVESEVGLLDVPFTAVHEVIFRNPSESPYLKTAKAIELGLSVFYDDRQDVCAEMSAAGILAFHVPRLSKKSDLESERM